MNDIQFSNPKIGDLVKIKDNKVSHGSESFWVIVTRILDNKAEGTVDNALIDSSLYQLGSKIIFDIRDVLTIYQHD